MWPIIIESGNRPWQWRVIIEYVNRPWQWPVIIEYVNNVLLNIKICLILLYSHPWRCVKYNFEKYYEITQYIGINAASMKLNLHA